MITIIPQFTHTLLVNQWMEIEGQPKSQRLIPRNTAVMFEKPINGGYCHVSAEVDGFTYEAIVRKDKLARATQEMSS